MFATTRWSLIVAPRDAAAARQALGELCQLYWYPLYAFIRRRGYAHDHAQDLTQEFFTRLLERDELASLDPSRGRFRSFLLAACKNFLANQRDREQALKRGGGRRFVPHDFADADRRYAHEPAHTDTPERLFDRRWAMTLLQHVLARLHEEYAAAGTGALFEQLKESLTGAGGPAHAEAAEALKMSAGAVKVAAHRLRKRYRDLLREEIAHTVKNAGEVEEEIQSLFTALG